MSLAYRILYAVGFQALGADGNVAHRRPDRELFARQEEGRERPYGSALDLELVDDIEMDVPSGALGYVKRAEPRFYRLRRA